MPVQQQAPGKGRKIFGIILLVWAGLAILGQLTTLTQGRGPGGGAEWVGWLIGVILFIVVPLVVGLKLVRGPKA
ncbi:hypothetical protein [Aestuariimicrobium ganziense]|uniref:hypothetical protein n=1 Tax=Aestuariimicrobium ganziense TaxID=2773677 RepID=UPI0019437420|nr:hypothetical protein [Aestuariimicrobium ganziense]